MVLNKSFDIRPSPRSFNQKYFSLTLRKKEMCKREKMKSEAQKNLNFDVLTNMNKNLQDQINQDPSLEQ